MKWGFDGRRARAARGVDADSVLGRFLATDPPAPSTPLAEVPLLAVDLETTGLDPARDRILAVGFVPVDGAEIRLSGAQQLVVRAEVDVGQSATVHGLTDDIVAAGRPLAEVLEIVLDALAGRVLLAHYSVIEEGFLSAAVRRLHGGRLPLRIVDTLQLQRRLARNQYDNPRSGSLRLGAARTAHGLPRYRAHAALTDALACAELYLAQRAAFEEREATTLSTLLV